MTNMHTGLSGHRIWQRAYYEHIVRDEQDLARIRAYVQQNPLRWALDEENPARIPAPADR
jgi:REP element-mobilizing transposase RayT